MSKISTFEASFSSFKDSGTTLSVSRIYSSFSRAYGLEVGLSLEWHLNDEVPCSASDNDFNEDSCESFKRLAPSLEFRLPRFNLLTVSILLYSDR